MQASIAERTWPIAPPVAVPDDLIEQVARDNVVPFLGPHISVGRGNEPGLPSPRELADELARRSGYTDTNQTLSRVAQHFELQQGRHALLSFLNKQLLNPNQQLLAAHRMIAALPWRVVVTSCLDDLLERSLREASCSYRSIVGNADIAYEDQDKLLLVRMYGSLDQPDSVVVTELDFLRWQDQVEQVLGLLKGLIASRTLLILGYDLEDEHLKSIYGRVTLPFVRNVRRSYAIGCQTSDYAVAWWQQLNVQVIPGEPAECLQHIAQRLQTPRLPDHPPAGIVVAPPPIPRQPYKFLNSYEESDHSIFFGRDKETNQILSKIVSFRIVLLHGKSGSGKTSLIKAGLMPSLRERGYTVVYSRTLTNPIESVETSINRALKTQIPQDPSLYAFMKKALENVKGTMILLLDQFEELFTSQEDSATQSKFLQDLGAVYADTSLDLKLVIGVREDAFAELSALKPQIPEIFYNDCRLELLGSEQARQAIVSPLALYGIRYEEAMVERIVKDLGGDKVDPPQLQIVCDRLYAQTGLEEKVISQALYDRLGGARTILAAYLDDVLKQYVASERVKLQTLLIEFITSGERRALPTVQMLIQHSTFPLAEVNRLLQELEQARLIRPLEGEKHYELVHEYLIPHISAWTTEEERARKLAHEMLDQGLTRWQNFHLPLYADELAIINTQRASLNITDETRALLVYSSVWADSYADYWLDQAPSPMRLQVLESALHDQQVIRRQRAIALAVRGGIIELIPHLREMAEKDGERAVRQDAVSGLVILQGQDIMPWLSDLLHGSFQEQRRALEAFELIQRTAPFNRGLTNDRALAWLDWRIRKLRWQDNRQQWWLTTYLTLIGGAIGGISGGALGAVVQNRVDLLVLNMVMGMTFGLILGTGIGFGFGSVLATSEPRRSFLYVIGAALGGAAMGFFSGALDLVPEKIAWGIPIGIVAGAGTGTALALLVNLTWPLPDRLRRPLRVVLSGFLGMITAGLLLSLGTKVHVVPGGPIDAVSVGAMTAIGIASGLGLAQQRVLKNLDAQTEQKSA